MDSHSPHLPSSDQRGKKLRQAHLAYSDFKGVDWSGRDLSGANLTGAYLVQANLRRAKLRGACMDRAVLCEAVMDGADCSGASFVDANLQKASACEADFRKADFTRANLGEAVLVRSSFIKAKLRFASLTDARFEECRMDRSEIYHTSLARTEFCTMSLRKAKAEGCLFEEAILDDVSLPECSARSKPLSFLPWIAGLAIALLAFLGWMALGSDSWKQILAWKEARLEQEKLALCQSLVSLESQIRLHWKKTGRKLNYEEAQGDLVLQKLLAEWIQYHIRLAHIEHEQARLQGIRIEEKIKPLDEAIAAESIEAYEKWRKEK